MLQYNFACSQCINMNRFLFLAILIAISSCKKSEPQDKNEIAGLTYFSIIEYTIDEWNSNYGRPLGIQKKVFFNNTVDSVATNTFDMDWAPVLKTFFETDISDEKYIGQYKFTGFVDDMTNTDNFMYEAKEKNLFTKKIQIVADKTTDRISSIYIEAEKEDRLGTKTVKLQYTPLKTISIQEMETSKTGQRKELRVLYEFL